MLVKNILELQEGIHDPAIFKAVFMIGGPGSGKSYITKELGLASMGFVSINSDIAFEFLAKKNNISMKMADVNNSSRDEIRTKAKVTTNHKKALGLEAKLGLVIDGTGADFEKTMKLKEELQSQGYEFFLVIVNTSKDTALKRNSERTRSVPVEIVNNKWNGVQKNIGQFITAFNNAIVLDNDGDKTQTDKQVNVAFKRIRKWATTPSETKISKEWIESNK